MAKEKNDSMTIIAQAMAKKVYDDGWWNGFKTGAGSALAGYLIGCFLRVKCNANSKLEPSEET